MKKRDIKKSKEFRKKHDCKNCEKKKDLINLKDICRNCIRDKIITNKKNLKNIDGVNYELS